MRRVGRIAERMQIFDREIGNPRLAGLSRQCCKIGRALLRSGHPEGWSEQKQRQDDSHDVIVAAQAISGDGHHTGMAMGAKQLI
jgi:hypothetical protein